MKETTEDCWEDEGGAVLTACDTCGKMVKPFNNGDCVFCWIKKDSQKDAPIFPTQHRDSHGERTTGPGAD